MGKKIIEVDDWRYKSKYFQFFVRCTIFLKPTKSSIMHWEGVFKSKNNRGWRLAIFEVVFFNFLLQNKIFKNQPNYQ